MKKLLPLLIILPTLASCSKPYKPPTDIPEHEEVNSVYYWKTTLQLDSAEQSFMTKHDVNRIYMRMFDVTPDKDWGCVPNATIQIPESQFAYWKSDYDSLEVVPVVYITLEALKAMNNNEGELARRIIDRIDNMKQFHNLPNVSELQIDCDWTKSTEEQFFTLCDSLRITLDRQNIPWRLSSTIRLHQLAGKVPPVDAGVLMVYNTGTFTDPDTENSIIRLEDVKPYLRYLKSYPLHLDVAYPTYSWMLLFNERKFKGLINGIDLADSTKFTKCGPNLYMANKDIPHNQTVIRKNDIIRLETSDIKEIMDVKAEIENRLVGRNHSNIIYHLDPDNLKKYSPDEIKSIFTVGR